VKIVFDINLYEDKGMPFLLWLENRVFIVNNCVIFIFFLY